MCGGVLDFSLKLTLITGGYVVDWKDCLSPRWDRFWIGCGVVLIGIELLIIGWGMYVLTLVLYALLFGGTH